MNNWGISARWTSAQYSLKDEGCDNFAAQIPSPLPSPRLGGARELTAASQCARSRRAGFSLIEVVVAIVILAIALTGLTQGITTALGASKESELQTTAALFAAGQIELLRAQTDWTDGTAEGDCGKGMPLYRWRQTVSPTDVDGLHEVAVVVESSQTGQSIFELKTLLFQMPADAASKSKSAKPRGNRA